MTDEWIKEAFKHADVTHVELMSYMLILLKLQSFVIKEFKDKPYENMFNTYDPENLLNKLTEHFFKELE